VAHSFKRGEIYRGRLNPQKGSEQAGDRPVLIFQINHAAKIEKPQFYNYISARRLERHY
jgi:hypothetical protein